MNERPDRDLVTLTLQGEDDAFTALVRRYQATVYNVCYRLCGDRATAEDLSQESFVRAHSKLNTFDLQRPFGPWVRRLSVNVSLNALKRVRPTTVSLDAARNVATQSPVVGDARMMGGSSDSADPEAAAIRGERTTRLREAIRSLPPHYRAVIELRHFQELSYAEIADALDWPPTDVKSRLFRARQALARALAKEQTDAAGA